MAQMAKAVIISKGNGETKSETKVDDTNTNLTEDLDEDEDSDDEWPPRTKKSKKKNKKAKKKKRRGRGQESLKQFDGEIGESENPTGVGELTIVDLCGYSYTLYKNAYWKLSIYDQSEVNPMTIEPIGSSKWIIFGKDEKPALWNQQQKGWLVPKKYDDKLDMMGAIKV